jgi:hypothetical protein
MRSASSLCSYDPRGVEVSINGVSIRTMATTTAVFVSDAVGVGSSAIGEYAAPYQNRHERRKAAAIEGRRNARA